MWLPLTHPLPGTLPATQECALIGIRTSDPLVRRPALNPLSHTSQGLFQAKKAYGILLQQAQETNMNPINLT